MSENSTVPNVQTLIGYLERLGSRIGEKRPSVSHHGNPAGEPVTLDWLRINALEIAARLKALVDRGADLTEMNRSVEVLLPIFEKFDKHDVFVNDQSWSFSYLWPVLGPVLSDLKTKTTSLLSGTANSDVFVDAAVEASKNLTAMHQQFKLANDEIAATRNACVASVKQAKEIETAAESTKGLLDKAKQQSELIQQVHTNAQSWSKAIGESLSGLDERNARTTQLAEEISTTASVTSQQKVAAERDALSIAERLKQADEMISKTNETYAHVSGERTTFDANVAEVKSVAEQVSPLRAQVNQDHADVVKKKAEAETALQSMNEFVSDAEKVRAQLDDLLGRAAEAALGSSFRSRSKSLTRSIQFWSFALVVSLAGMVWLTINVLIPLLKGMSPPTDIIGIGTRMTTSLLIVGPALWLAWLATTRINQLSRLDEDYAFKFASAMALESYREYAQSIDKELEAALMAAAITRFAESPLRLVSAEEHATPYSEMLTKIGDWVNSIASRAPGLKLPEKVSAPAALENKPSNSEAPV